MEDNIGTMCLECVVKTGNLAEVADNRNEVKARELVLKLKAKIVHRSLGIVKEHELLDAEACQLAHKLRAD